MHASSAGHAVRADLLLVHLGLSPSRTLAQRLIVAGRVRAAGQPVRRPSQDIPEGTPLSVEAGDEGRFVSRGGLKLEAALEHFGVGVIGHHCLDAGQSTGGFTHCLLVAGAAAVVGIDVGHGQLDPRLQSDPRVTCLEGVNLRDLKPDVLGQHLPVGGFHRVVVDVSFISLTLVLGPLALVAAPHAELVALIKPQFEAGPAGVDRRGLLREPGEIAHIVDRVESAARHVGWHPLGLMDSPIRGGDGNRELLMHARRVAAPL